MIITKFSKWPLYLKLRLIFGVFLLLFIVISVFLKVVPFGKVSYAKDFSSRFNLGSGFFIDFQPGIRIDNRDKESLKVISDPVYFSLFTPRTFDKAIFTIVYKDNLSSSTPIVELGVLHDEMTSAYKFKPIQNKILDKLRFTWKRLADENGEVILQREDYYNNISNFRNDLNNNSLQSCVFGLSSCLASYNYKLPLEYSLPDYISVYPLVISKNLRGSHQLYVYFNEDSWKISFSFSDLNLNEGKDDVVVNLYSRDQLLSTKEIKDDGKLASGNDFDFQKGENIGSIEFFGNDFGSGLYKIEIKTSDDILINRIESSSDRLVFKNKFWSVNDSEFNIFTDSKKIIARSLDFSGLGDITFDDSTFSIDKSHKNFDLETNNINPVHSIILDRGGISIESDGVFSFDKNKIFNPEQKNVNSSFDADKYQYVIANYSYPKEKKGLKTAIVEFDLKNAYRKDSKYSFVISVPGLDQAALYSGDNNYLNSLGIKEIKVDLRGRTLFQKLLEIVKNEK